MSTVTIISTRLSDLRRANFPLEKLFTTVSKNISEEDYNHVQTVWKKFNMTTLWDLHDHYVLTDVLLLADVFERFRNMTLDY